MVPVTKVITVPIDMHRGLIGRGGETVRYVVVVLLHSLETGHAIARLKRYLLDLQLAQPKVLEIALLFIDKILIMR